jgi:hypothetical protein
MQLFPGRITAVATNLAKKGLFAMGHSQYGFRPQVIGCRNAHRQADVPHPDMFGPHSDIAAGQPVCR